jgi:nucleoside-diphosphate-sugar epimerase
VNDSSHGLRGPEDVLDTLCAVFVAIAGAHGKVAMRLIPRLVARGDAVLGLIRNPDHAEDVRAAGADPVVCDLEHATVQEVALAVKGAEAAVFAAGAGAGSGAARKLTMDRDGAIKLLEVTSADRVPFVIVSSVGAENPPDGDDVFSVYLRAKAQADDAVMASDRDWTVVRPGRLTDDPGIGRARIDTTPFRGQIPRDDVAGLLAAVLHDPRASRRILYVNAGEEPLEKALERVLEAN